MELPFDYIVFYLFGILKYRNKKTRIKRNNLYFCIKKLIDFIIFDDKEKYEIISQFDFNEEVSVLINDYFEYLDLTDDTLVLDSSTSMYDINSILSSIEEDYDEEIIERIKVEIDNNYEFLELLGINIQKQIASNLIDLEMEIEMAYNDFPRKTGDDKFYYNLKKLLFKRKIFNMTLKNNMDIEEYYDICTYVSSLAYNSIDDCISINFMMEDDSFIEDELVEDPYLRAIFFKEDLALFNIAKRIGIDSREKEVMNLKFSEQKFYVTFLNFLSEEMTKISEKELYYEFRICKYRLINVLDSVCDTLYIMDDKKEFSDEISFYENYSFIENKIFFFIDEVLKYDDDKYNFDESNYFNLVNYYNNIIKKVLVKTYYYLTSDDRVISAIKNNSLYGVNKISTELLDEAINGDNKKTKKRN